MNYDLFVHNRQIINETLTVDIENQRVINCQIKQEPEDTNDKYHCSPSSYKFYLILSMIR